MKKAILKIVFFFTLAEWCFCWQSCSSSQTDSTTHNQTDSLTYLPIVTENYTPSPTDEELYYDSLLHIGDSLLFNCDWVKPYAKALYNDYIKDTVDDSFYSSDFYYVRFEDYFFCDDIFEMTVENCRDLLERMLYDISGEEIENTLYYQINNSFLSLDLSHKNDYIGGYDVGYVIYDHGIVEEMHGGAAGEELFTTIYGYSVCDTMHNIHMRWSAVYEGDDPSTLGDYDEKTKYLVGDKEVSEEFYEKSLEHFKDSAKSLYDSPCEHSTIAIEAIFDMNSIAKIFGYKNPKSKKQSLKEFIRGI